MKTLSINEIKKDIKQGYGYMEYECNYYNGQLTVISDPRENNMLVNYARGEYVMTYKLNRDQFITMSRVEFNKLFNENLFYNMQPIEQ